MNRRSPKHCAVCFVAATVLGAACGSAARAGRELAAVSLPDLSGAVAPVQRQIRDEYAALTRKAASASAAERVDAYGRIGMLLMAAEYREAAIPYFENARALAPDDLRWPYYLAHVNRLQNRLPVAAALFERVLQLRPDDVPARVWLARIHLDLGEGAAAASVLTAMTSAIGQSVPLLYWLGRAELAAGDAKQASSHLEQALALDPRPSRIQSQLATAYRQLGDVAHVESIARAAGQREPEPDDPLLEQLDEILESSRAYDARAKRALDAGKLAEAVSLYRTAGDLAPSDASPREHLGTALFLAGDLAGARAAFEDAVRVAPRFARAHYSLALLFDSMRDRTSALRELTIAIKVDPSYIDAHLALGDMLRRARRVDDALNEYRSAVRLDPGSSTGVLGHVMVLGDAMRYREALQIVERVSETQPGVPELVHARARLLAAAPDALVRNGQRAFALMNAGLAHEPRTLGFAETMAMVAAETGQYGEAMTWQRQAVEAGMRRALPSVVERLQRILAGYEQRQPCRSPWSLDEDLRLLQSVPLQ